MARPGLAEDRFTTGSRGLLMAQARPVGCPVQTACHVGRLRGQRLGAGSCAGAGAGVGAGVGAAGSTGSVSGRISTRRGLSPSPMSAMSVVLFWRRWWWWWWNDDVVVDDDAVQNQLLKPAPRAAPSAETFP